MALNRVWKSLSLAVAACALALVPAGAAHADPEPFSAASFWNTPLGPASPTDVNSAQYMTAFGNWMKDQAARGRYQYITINGCGSPIYTVPAGQPTVRVTAKYSQAPGLQDQMNAVPIPPGAIASQNCKDEYMTVYQPSSDQLWDLWHMHKLADGSWGADWGGHMTNVSQNPGHFDARWGVTATSLPLMGGLIRLSDLQQGHIDHALAFAIPYAKQSVFSWPAQRTDGRGTDQWSLPEGARLRLDPSVNVAALNLSPLGRMVAQALQTYGMVLRDQTQDAMLFFSEQPPPGQTPAQAYGPYLGGKAAWQQFTGIPWDKMQLMPLSNSDCSVLQAPVGLPVSSFCGMPYSLTDQSPQGGSMAPGPGPKPKPSGSTPSPTNAASAGGQSSSSSSASSRPVVVKLACNVHRVRIVFRGRKHERVRRVTVTVNGHRRHVHVHISRTHRSMSLRLSRRPGKRMTVTVRVTVKRGHKVSRRTIRRIYPACDA